MVAQLKASRFHKINDTEVKNVNIDYYVKQNTEVGMQYDQSNEKRYQLVDQYPVESSLLYPKPGTRNPTVSLHVYHVDEQKLETILDKDEGLGRDFVVYQASWIDNENFLVKETDRTSKILSKIVHSSLVKFAVIRFGECD